MNTSLDSLRLTYTIAAARERVFAAWTTPSQVQGWFGRPDGFDVSRVEMDAVAGGSYRIEIAGADVTAAIVGRFVEVVPFERLAFTFEWETPLLDVMDVGETLVTVLFANDDGRTRITLVHERLTGERAASFHEFGWRNGFERLDEQLG